MRRTLLLLLPLALAAGLAQADPRERERERERDHDRARAALQAGEVLPLAAVLRRVAQRHPGDVLEVDLEREHGRWIYELKLLQPGGALLKLEVDARTGEVLQARPGRR